MAFPPQPVDSSGVPISSSYIPNDAFYAIQASARKKTDTISNVYTTPVFEQRTIEDLRSGLLYVAATPRLATATNANLVMGASLFNPSTAKNILVLSARVMQSASTSQAQLNLTTVDPALAQTSVPVNLSAGGAASVLTTSFTFPAANAAASVSITGTMADSLFLQGLTPVDFLLSSMGILLPAGANNGVAIFMTVPTAGQFYAISFRWVEY